MSKRLHMSIPKPCSADWSSMTPEDRTRHCTLCDKSVHPLVEYDEQEATALLQQENVCVRVQYTQTGEVRLRTGISSMLFVGLLACGDRSVETLGEPMVATDPVELLQVEPNAEVKLDIEEPPPPTMGKVAIDLNPTPHTAPVEEAMLEEMGEMVLPEPIDIKSIECTKSEQAEKTTHTEK